MAALSHTEMSTLEVYIGGHFWCLSLGPLPGSSRGHNSYFTAEECGEGNLFRDAKKQYTFMLAPNHMVTSGIISQWIPDWRIQDTVPKCFSQLLRS